MKVVIGFNTVIFLGINVKSTWTVNGQISFRENHSIRIFITIRTWIRKCVCGAIFEGQIDMTSFCGIDGCICIRHGNTI